MTTGDLPLCDANLEEIGRSCKDAFDGNLLVGSFAAELVGESYPFSKEMCDTVFNSYSDRELGRKFADWMEVKKQ